MLHTEATKPTQECTGSITSSSKGAFLERNRPLLTTTVLHHHHLHPRLHHRLRQTTKLLLHPLEQAVATTL